MPSDETPPAPRPRHRGKPGAISDVVGNAVALARNLAGHLDRIATDAVRDAGGVARSAGSLARHVVDGLDRISLDAARDAGQIARDAEALSTAAADKFAVWRGNLRATPRFARVLAEGARLLALYRWHRLRGAARGLDGIGDDAHRALAIRAREACIELRGGILKLGQIASCRPDVIPRPWIEELAQLQDRVPAIDGDAVIARIIDELGGTLEERFASFEREPIAAASLAQVHGAVLADGTEVAVKVQIPGIEDIIEADVAALRALAALTVDLFPGLDLGPLVGELGKALRGELDYIAEGDACEQFAAIVAGTRVHAPAIVRSHSTSRVLTMHRVRGERLLDALDRCAAAGDDGAAERDRILGAMLSSVADQVFVQGLVHGDPHPGNFLVEPDGRLAVLDFGCMLRLTRDERRAWARLLGALVTRNPDLIADQLGALGFAAVDRAALIAIAGRVVEALRPGADMAQFDWATETRAITDDVIAAAKGGAGIAVPPTFALLGRVLATVAGLLVRYKPRLEPYALIAPALARAL